MKQRFKNHTPPRLPQRLLRWYCKPELAEDIEGDIHEDYNKRYNRSGRRTARFYYWIDVIRFFRPFAIKNIFKTRVNNTMFRINTLIAFRNLKKNPGYSLTNIFGLSVALAVSLLAITLLYELHSFDAFHEHEQEIYRVQTNVKYDNYPLRTEASTTLALLNYLENDFPEIEKVAAFRFGVDDKVKANEKSLRLSGLMANQATLSVFSFPMLAGSREALSEPNSVVLTESAASKLFDKTDVLGELIEIGSEPYKVTGLIEDVPRKSHIQFEMLVSLSSLDEYTEGGSPLSNWNDRFQSYIYIQTGDHEPIQRINEVLGEMGSEHYSNPQMALKFSLEPLGNIATGGVDNNPIGFVFPTTKLRFVEWLAAIVVILACFNYTNLTLAKSFGRTKEVGTRKAIGAKTGQLLGQFTFESVIVSLLSLSLAFLIFYLSKDAFLTLIPTRNLLTLELSWQIVVMALALTITLGIVSALFPAFVLSRLKAIEVMTENHSNRLLKRQNLRKVLLTIQVGVAILFINGAYIIHAQYEFIQAHDLGYNTDDIYNLNLQGNSFETFRAEFSSIPGIDQISQSEFVTNSGSAAAYYGYYDNPADSTYIFSLDVNPAYLGLHEYRLLAGTGFDDPDASGKSVVVNREFLEQFGLESPQQAIGEAIHFHNEIYFIQGVVENFHYERLSYEIKPFAFRLIGHDSGFANIKAEPSGTIDIMDRLKTKWETLYPDQEFQAIPYYQLLERSNRGLLNLSQIIRSITLLSLIISLLGILGLVAYDARARLKEITIRKVLGAELKHLVFKLSKSYLLVFLLAAALAIPLTAWNFDEYILQRYSYHINLGISQLGLGALILFLFLAITISYQVRSVSRKAPLSALRNQ